MEPPKRTSSLAEGLLGYQPKPPRDKTIWGVICLAMICGTLIAITWMITHA